ncbi:unnamed protein product [Nesidiocoris tenuis]|uniref:Phospholysine phosphohistidine inorganic pyrophosphate phosphatase n=1 Tax=Nesidiocoris tenuis TaxID=355587 RepID=A0A6H5GPT1_9HEMI|nr:unnamed protein product [Nesidiocoris tenuis]
MSYDFTANELFSPVPCCVDVLKKENLRPHLLVHPRMVPEFDGVDTKDPNCVVVADAYDHFTFENLNNCFRKLLDMDKPILISLGIGKYYMDDDGLALDVGGFTKCLEYATGVAPRIIGKPSSEYFMMAASDMKLSPNEVCGNNYWSNALLEK